MNHKEHKYTIPEDETPIVSEPAVAYAIDAHPMLQNEAFSISFSHKEVTSEEKIAYLRAHLHPSTVQLLESENWMQGAAFPCSSTSDDDSWIDEAEAMGDSDIVPDEIMQNDLAVWKSVR